MEVANLLQILRHHEDRLRQRNVAATGTGDTLDMDDPNTVTATNDAVDGGERNDDQITNNTASIDAAFAGLRSADPAFVAAEEGRSIARHDHPDAAEHPTNVL